MTPQLQSEIDRLIEAGDEKALEAFVVEHFSEFPENIQQKLFATLYADAVGANDPKKIIQGIQLEGIEALEEIEKVRTSLQSNKPAH